MRELSTPLTEEDKAWLRSWNRGHEIPEDEQAVQTEPEKPATPPTTEPPKDPAAPDPQTPVGGDGTNPATDAGDGGTAEVNPEDPFNGEEPPADYNDWTNKQLEHELSVGRGLPKTGNKAELVARLIADDEANPE